MTVLTTIKQLLNDVKGAYVDGLTPYKATGKTIKSLRTEVTVSGKNVKGTLFGSGVTNILKTGRKPGAMPPVSAILEWVRAKRIANSANERSVSWAIAKSIAKKGTLIYRGQAPALDVEESIERLQDKALEELNGLIKKQIKESITV